MKNFSMFFYVHLRPKFEKSSSSTAFHLKHAKHIHAWLLN